MPSTVRSDLRLTSADLRLTSADACVTSAYHSDLRLTSGRPFPAATLVLVLLPVIHKFPVMSTEWGIR